uniref:Uncharacterized protein n=1 Tax=Neobodo designis TaxID=312471 RepID=A0A7S1M2I1_NEODS|mmetsp:Transcript_32964/g.101824  ORF Transcript_32964/g.101824 Transcript_32964/m.101824 type:complete len:337 (+) Transcript_32964:214-1224(+)
MGCASSVHDEHRTHMMDDGNESVRARIRVYLENADEGLHADADFDQPLNEQEQAQHRKLEDEWSIHSRGDIIEEPTPFSLNMREKKKVVAARVESGINGDPCQFEPTPEPPSEIDKSCKQVRAWFAYNDALIAAAEQDLQSSFSDGSEVHASPLRTTSGFGGVSPYRPGPTTDVTTPDEGYVGDSSGSRGTNGLLTVSSSSHLNVPVSPGRSPGRGGLDASHSTLDFGGGSVFALDHGRILRRPGAEGSSSTPHVVATPGTPFLGAGPRMPLRADVLASHLRRLRALEKGEVPSPKAGGAPRSPVSPQIHHRQPPHFALGEPSVETSVPGTVVPEQ